MIKSYRSWRNILLVCAAGALLLNGDRGNNFVNAASFSLGSLTGQSVKPVKVEGKTFGVRLAAAALQRTNHFVLYVPWYQKISYPNGDVPFYMGVCTDVVVRSYRALGIDLQKRVHKRLGGDRNIQHRRVRVLRKYFARYGRSLPVKKDPKRFKPGDIVTYYVPEGRLSKDHIAIVSSRKTITGRPMIVHNGGYGPQLEDKLFAWKINGHYRYQPR